MNQAFETLLAEFAASKGLPVEPGAYALEFQSEEQQVIVMPHPKLQDHLMVEVGVAELGQDGLGEELASLLLQINEAARFEHAWSIFMDTRGAVTLGTCHPMGGLGLADVESLIVDGLDRARALLSLLQAQAQQVLDAQRDGEPQPLGPGAGSPTMLRG